LSDATLPISITKRRARLLTFSKRLLQVFISYEVATYSLATLQAIGLSLPTMVPQEAKAVSFECDKNLQAVTDTIAQFRTAHLESTAPYNSSVVANLVKSMPQCPGGGHYEVLVPGMTVKTESGANFVVTRDRVVARCVHEDGTTFHSGLAVSFVR
jgi:hypothetical protein